MKDCFFFLNYHDWGNLLHHLKQRLYSPKTWKIVPEGISKMAIPLWRQWLTTFKTENVYGDIAYSVKCLPQMHNDKFNLPNPCISGA